MIYKINRKVCVPLQMILMAKKPNDLELLEKYFPINNTFSKGFGAVTYKNNLLNFTASRSKVHASLDSVV